MEARARMDHPHPVNSEPPWARLATGTESLVVAVSTSNSIAQASSSTSNSFLLEPQEQRGSKKPVTEEPQTDLGAEPELDLESDSDLPFEELSEDPENSPVSASVHRAVFDLANPDALRRHWSELADKLQGVTADMVRDPLELELKEENLVCVTLRDTYTVRECLKPDRKQSIEAVFSEVCRQVMRVDFKPSADAIRKSDAATPQLSRAQQLRILLERDFIKQAMETFSAEVKNFYHPKPK